MRLIDADLFKENIRSGLYIFCQVNKEDICNAIDCESTVEIATNLQQRPQGRWITEDEIHCLYYCSECRSNGNKYQPFCGWCGAQMKGDSNNG